MKNRFSFLTLGIALALLLPRIGFGQSESSETNSVTLSDFQLIGNLSADNAEFVLTATANVESANGGTLELLSGAVALTELSSNPKWQLRAEQGRYVAGFERSGKYPITLKFAAAVKQQAGWKSVDFRVASSALRPVELRGVAADTQFEFTGAARVERVGNNFVSYLPVDGAVKLSWKEARPEEEGKLFYAAEMLSQVSVSPGLMRQVAWLDFKVMQGELSRVTMLLRGAGEVTRVSGENVLSWHLEPVASEREKRRLIVQLNQPQKDAFAVQVHLQSPLGAFPQSAEMVQVQPEGATRLAGYIRVVNEGAVRLEVLQARGLSQISPEQFPDTEATKAVLRPSGGQRFAYRFSGSDYALRLQADQILPELSVSQVLTYHHGHNELAIEAELEVEVREAPLRELLVRVPKGYAIARLNASGMTDYFLSESVLSSNAESGALEQNELRIVYGQPVVGRQLVQLRLERNKSLGEAIWNLPRVEVAQAKSARGNIGILTEAGFRLTPERTIALSELAPAFFPRQVANLQTSFRISEPGWQASLRVERLPQTVQADVLHLFSVAEGVAYGSSVMTYLISGAPVAVLHVELSDEYGNVEFTGKDVRNWQKTTNGYLVQLHAPVAGTYTLLATYERTFQGQGETLTFTGARPLDAQSESGHTLIISAYQFRVTPAEVSPGLLALETAEVPAEYRLFFDAPILTAYRYTSRPFNLRLALSPLEQGKSLDQVVDRASLVTRISKEGQVLTSATYFVKSRGNPNFRLTLPAGVELWSALVNGATVVPVKDRDANLIPLPQQADPNAVLKLELKLAAKSGNSEQVAVAVPIVSAPVMLAEWKIEPDAGQHLIYQRGSLTPVGGVPDVSGFAQLARCYEENRTQLLTSVATIFGLLLLTLGAWIWAGRATGHRYCARRATGLVVGFVAVLLAAMMGVRLVNDVAAYAAVTPSEITFLAPVQQAGSVLTVEVANVAKPIVSGGVFASLVLGAIAAGLWFAAWRRNGWSAWSLQVIGGLLLAWAALRLPNGAPWFFVVLAGLIVVHVLTPLLRQLWLVPQRVTEETKVASATAAMLIIGLLGLVGSGCATSSKAKVSAAADVPELVTQQIMVEKEFVTGTAKIRWGAEKGAVLTVLTEPAVLTRFSGGTEVQLQQATENGRRVQQVVAQRSGTFDLEVQYQVRIAKGASESKFGLPTPYGLVNRAEVTVQRQDVDVFSAQAVSVQREFVNSNTVAKLVLSPVTGAQLGWKPRSRDAKHEKAVFYAEWSQLYVPAAGVIEGAHQVAIRPAQGELTELLFNVPRRVTVTDVLDGNLRKQEAESRVSLWRFDPDTRKLRVTLARPQSRPFTVLVRSQVSIGTFPMEQTVGLLSVVGAAGEIGLLGLATGNEVQLDQVNVEKLSALNLEDFPANLVPTLSAQIPGLTVRRAFRYADSGATVSLQASAVEPDVRVETQDTLSLGEDRTVLASSATVDISRAGIFRLSFVLPNGFDVESISGAAMSHWTELKTEVGRVITLHLKGKTEGRQQFSISLAGSGVKATRSWVVPQLSFREANKQQGTLLVVPEQGMQLQTVTAEGLSQLEPQRAGIRQKGVLAFRILQSAWQLALDVEQVEPWVQVTSLQHATVTEAQVKISANLRYQIENTGLKTLHVYLPTNAESVRFSGDLVADFLRKPDAVTNGLQLWEVKLQRRVIGSYLLQVNYQTLMPEQADEVVLRGVRASEVNLQRGFVTVQTGGRVQVNPDATSQSLQPTEWQSVPRSLQQNLGTVLANYAFRLVDPAFALPLKLERHEAVKLLPARVHQVEFTSVISDAGVMLTQARLEISPGDKRLLHVKLPVGANYWFAFVNQNGVWPWREGETILIPLDQPSRDEKPVPVEIFYSSQVGKGGRDLDLELLAPKFDLPLENITWRVHLNEKWEVKRWAGTMQFADERLEAATGTLDLQSYLQREVMWQREKTQEAEQLLAFGNRALELGAPQQARRAFQSAYGLSTHDNAFNEDARVQLHNLKLQQALVGLNVRQAATLGDTTGLSKRFRDLRGAKELNYTQQDAKGIIERNDAEENAATMRLAEKLIQQQEAAVPAAAAIRASIPTQGRVLTFQRSVAVDREADLRVSLKAGAARTASAGMKVMMLVTTLLVFGGTAAMIRLVRGSARANVAV